MQGGRGIFYLSTPPPPKKGLPLQGVGMGELGGVPTTWMEYLPSPPDGVLDGVFPFISLKMSYIYASVKKLHKTYVWQEYKVCKLMST